MADKFRVSKTEKTLYEHEYTRDEIIDILDTNVWDGSSAFHRDDLLALPDQVLLDLFLEIANEGMGVNEHIWEDALDGEIIDSDDWAGALVDENDGAEYARMVSSMIKGSDEWKAAQSQRRLT